jgi:hypothetical protein
MKKQMQQQQRQSRRKEQRPVFLRVENPDGLLRRLDPKLDMSDDEEGDCGLFGSAFSKE